ncbi:MAG: hypothetical protein MJ224_07350 [archaeon]|nr:hypothetical protein [archaeon]
MINIVAGFDKNENILLAAKEANKHTDLNVDIVESEEDLIKAYSDPNVDAVVRGSLKSSKIMKYLRELDKDSKIHRATYINTDGSGFTLNVPAPGSKRGYVSSNENFEFLLSPVGIDEGNTLEERFELAIQSCKFIQSLGMEVKIAILADGRSDDVGRSERIDKSLEDSEKLTQMLLDEFEKSSDFDNDSDDISKHYSVKNYYILLEQAIKDKNNIIISPDGISGNILFRALVLLNSWPSCGAVTLGIDKIFIDTSRDQSVKGYLRSLNLAYDLAKDKK